MPHRGVEGIGDPGIGRRRNDRAAVPGPGISCRHCASAITAEVVKAQGVETVQIEPGTNWMVVCGHDLDIDDIRAAVMQAGHEAEL